ncbi:hypothetical protein CTI12_AA424210 [Artemisia annua]|uniref:Uncharacterized protein n=1 Tax=Artemisia annua TaxID=35608 RepID=A0A2U1M3S1_ARTAN|nr:hypothetical protein CTI12_AA424210 [Artemisia annua]
MLLESRRGGARLAAIMVACWNGVASSMIWDLDEQETVTGTVLEAMDRELEEISANNYTRKCANQESRARERARDQTIETTSAMIRELQRRIDETSGKP